MIVARTIRQFLGDAVRVSNELGGFGDKVLLAGTANTVIADGLSSTKLRTVLETLDASITVEADALYVTISRDRLAGLVGISLPTGALDDPIQLTVPSTSKRRGHELRLVYAVSTDQPTQRDERLIDLVGRGWAAWQQLGTGERIADAARRSHPTRLARLRFLAPDIVIAIIEGRQPVELTARTLPRIADLPLAWGEQRRVLGFCRAPPIPAQDTNLPVRDNNPEVPIASDAPWRLCPQLTELPPKMARKREILTGSEQNPLPVQGV